MCALTNHMIKLGDTLNTFILFSFENIFSWILLDLCWIMKPKLTIILFSILQVYMIASEELVLSYHNIFQSLMEVSVYINHHLEKALPKCNITFLTDFSFIDKIRLIILSSLEDVTLVILVNLALFLTNALMIHNRSF